MKSITENGQNVDIPLGDFVIVSLDRENSMNPSATRHMAYIRYNGLFNGVAHLEMGEYDGRKDHQEGRLIYFPKTKEEGTLDYRVNTRGQRIKLDRIIISPYQFSAIDSTERQTAIRD